MSDDPKTRTVKRGSLAIGPNATLALGDSVDAELSPAKIEKLTRVTNTLVAYRAAVKDLLNGRYAMLRAVAPRYMTDSCCPMAFILEDGIIVRHDLKTTPEQKGIVAIADGTLASLSPALSGNFVHCPVNSEGYDPGQNVLTLTLSSAPIDAPHLQKPFITHRLCAIVHRPVSTALQESQNRRRPVPFVALRNEFDVQLSCVQMPESGGSPQPFLIRSRFRLPLGYEAFEVFPPYDHKLWNPDLAPYWAETDLLASVVERNLIDERFRAIDPSAQARKEVVQMLSGFKSLLDGPEEPIHQYIKQHPSLLLPTQVKAWSKLPLGARETDFVLRDASGDYLLVELEKPSHELFGSKGKPRAALEHAIDQILDWKRYLADNIATVQRELGLDGISTNPRALVVIGRSNSLTEANRRKLTAMENDRPKLKIMTYDDLLANATATYENILGPLWDPGPNAEVYFIPQQPGKI